MKFSKDVGQLFIFCISVRSKKKFYYGIQLFYKTDCKSIEDKLSSIEKP